jgi:hypothetical protein
MNIDPGRVDQVLNALPYPLDKTKLIEMARRMGANDQMVSALNRLPDKTFNSAQDVKSQLGSFKK